MKLESFWLTALGAIYVATAVIGVLAAFFLPAVLIWWMVTH